MVQHNIYSTNPQPRDIDIGKPPIPETFREVLEDIIGSKLDNLESLSSTQIERLEGLKTAIELILGQEVDNA